MRVLAPIPDGSATAYACRATRVRRAARSRAGVLVPSVPKVTLRNRSVFNRLRAVVRECPENGGIKPR